MEHKPGRLYKPQLWQTQTMADLRSQSGMTEWGFILTFVFYVIICPRSLHSDLGLLIIDTFSSTPLILVPQLCLLLSNSTPLWATCPSCALWALWYQLCWEPGRVLMVLWLPLGVSLDLKPCRESHPSNESAGPTKSRAFWEIQIMDKNEPLCFRKCRPSLAGGTRLTDNKGTGCTAFREGGTVYTVRVYCEDTGCAGQTLGSSSALLPSSRDDIMSFALSILWSHHLWNQTVPAASQIYGENCLR